MIRWCHCLRLCPSHSFFYSWEEHQDETENRGHLRGTRYKENRAPKMDLSDILKYVRSHPHGLADVSSSRHFMTLTSVSPDYADIRRLSPLSCVKYYLSCTTSSLFFSCFPTTRLPKDRIWQWWQSQILVRSNISVTMLPRVVK